MNGGFSAIDEGRVLLEFKIGDQIENVVDSSEEFAGLVGGINEVIVVAIVSEDKLFGEIEAGEFGGRERIDVGGGSGNEVRNVGEAIVEGRKDEKHVISDVFGCTKRLDYVLSSGKNSVFAFYSGRHC